MNGGTCRLRLLRNHLVGAANTSDDGTAASALFGVVKPLPAPNKVDDGAAADRRSRDVITSAKEEVAIRGLMAALRDPERQQIRRRFWNECANFPGLLAGLGPDKTVEQHRQLCFDAVYALQGPGNTTGIQAMDMMLERPDLYFEMGHALHCVDLSLAIKSGVQFTLWGGSVMNLGTQKHHDLYREQIASFTLPGCFAMTELEHGSNVGSIGTQASYDVATEEFIVHTPHDGATKWWIGNAATDGRAATVFAQLIIGDDEYGVHAFIVPLRDESGATMRGVTIKDCGIKVGLNGVDNGAIQFNHVRIPRDNLLDRFGAVAADGTYSSHIASPTKRFAVTLGALTGGRVALSVGSAAVSQLAVTIAVRYASMRRQFGQLPEKARPGDKPVKMADNPREELILDYPPHQRKLMPLLANCYAHQFATDFLVQRYVAMKNEGNEPSDETLAQVHTLSSGLKPMVTWATHEAIDICREACGGHGYSAINRLGELREDHDVWKTFEGDNTVLLQQLAGDLMKSYGKSAGSNTLEHGLFMIKRFLGLDNSTRKVSATASNLRDPSFYLTAFKVREEQLLHATAMHLQGDIKRMPVFSAFRKNMNDVLSLARAHVERLVLEQFIAKVKEAEITDPETAVRLKRLCDLYAIYRIASSPETFHSARAAAMLTAQVDALCTELREDALALVAAFDIPDHIIRAPIGLAEPNMSLYLRAVGFDDDARKEKEENIAQKVELVSAQVD